MGLVVVGYGCSHLFYGALTRLLANIYGWRGAILLNAGMFLHCIPLSAPFRALPLHQNPPSLNDDKLRESKSAVTGDVTRPEAADSKKTRNVCASVRKTFTEYKRLLQNVRFCLITLGTVLVVTGMFTLFAHTPNRAVQSGIDKTRASLLMSFLGGASLFGRLFFSIIANSERVSTVLCFSLSSVLGGVVTAAMYLTDTFAGLTVGAVLGGVFFGKFRQ